MPQDRKQPNENDGSEKKQITLSQFFPTKKGFQKNKKKKHNQPNKKRDHFSTISSETTPPARTRSRTPTTDKLITPSQSIHSTARHKSKSTSQSGEKFARSSIHNKIEQNLVSNRDSGQDRKRPGQEITNPSFYCSKSGVAKLDFSQDSEKNSLQSLMGNDEK